MQNEFDLSIELSFGGFMTTKDYLLYFLQIKKHFDCHHFCNHSEMKHFFDFNLPS